MSKRTTKLAMEEQGILLDAMWERCWDDLADIARFQRLLDDGMAEALGLLGKAAYGDGHRLYCVNYALTRMEAYWASKPSMAGAEEYEEAIAAQDAMDGL